MDDIFQINLAKTQFREAYNTADIDRLLSVFQEGFADMSDGFPSRFGPVAAVRLRERARELFATYNVNLVVIIDDILPLGEGIFEFGWHEFTLSPKNGGSQLHQRQRYFDLWRKDAEGRWKIQFTMSNADVRDVFNGKTVQWFLSRGGLSEAVSS